MPIRRGGEGGATVGRPFLLLYKERMYKYVRSRVDGPSSRYTGDDDVGYSLVCPSINRRQKEMTFPVLVQFINLCDNTPVLLRTIAY